MNERAGRDDGEKGTESEAMERLERIAAKVDEEAAEMPAEPREREILGQMRDTRDALRQAGPARTSEGFADRVLAKLAEAQREAQVVRLRRRRDRLVVWAQAASLALLVGLYGALLATTRVHDVGPRWNESSATAGKRPDAGASLEVRECASLLPPRFRSG